MPQTIAIVGASLTGASAAATLREDGFDGRVVLLGAEPQLPYDRPPLSKAYLRGGMPFEKTLLRPPEFYRERNIETRLGTRVVSVDPEKRTLELQDGERLEFDSVLIATGGRNRRFPIPGLDLPGVYDLRTVADADRIRDAIARGGRAVVVGMGFIGAEVAASMRQCGLEVTAIEPFKTPLYRALGEEIGRVVEGLHRDHGVEHWQNGVKQGAAAARSMLGRAQPYDEVHWFWSDQYDANIQYAGFHAAWDAVVVRGSLPTRKFMAFYMAEGRVESIVAINQGRDLRRALPIIKARLAGDPARLADPDLDLRTLAPPETPP